MKNIDECGKSFVETIDSFEIEQEIADGVSIIIVVDVSVKVPLDVHAELTVDGNDVLLKLIAGDNNINVSCSISYDAINRKKPGLELSGGTDAWSLLFDINLKGASLGYNRTFDLDDSTEISLTIALRYSSVAGLKKTAISAAKKIIKACRGGTYPVIGSNGGNGTGGGGVGGVWIQTGGGAWYFWVMQPR